jgi:putative FmdB family regulatory protein
MPTYEYVCDKCSKTFEVFQRITDQPITKCIDENCAGPAHRILSGGAGFLFKGSGFYITDYRSDSYKKSAEKDKTVSGSTPSPSASTTGSSTASPSAAK